MKYDNHCFRCKQIHIAINGQERDRALIDALLLENDHIGSLLPFAADNLKQLFLTRAEPASVGMSPIGGYLMPCNQQDDFGVMVNFHGTGEEKRVRVPISPGLYETVVVTSCSRMDLGQSYRCAGPGILAFDGDRSIQVDIQDSVDICVRRDGPWVIEPKKILTTAAEHGLLYQ